MSTMRTYIYIDTACLPLSSDSFPASLLHPNSSPLIYFIPHQGRGSSLGSGHVPGSEPSLRTASQNMLTICYQIKCKGELVKMQCKSLWIKVSAKCMNVNLKCSVTTHWRRFPTGPDLIQFLRNGAFQMALSLDLINLNHLFVVDHKELWESTADGLLFSVNWCCNAMSCQWSTAQHLMKPVYNCLETVRMETVLLPSIALLQHKKACGEILIA